MVHARRTTLVRVLLAHGEEDLARRVPSLTDVELELIGKRADHYAFSSEHAVLPWGTSMGISRALALAAVDVLEGASRELQRRDGQRDRSAEEETLRRLHVVG